MRLNGWQRLWVLASIAWICATSAVGYSTRPAAEFAPHHPAYYYQLSPASRALLLPPSQDAATVEVEMPNGYVLRFRPNSSSEDQERIAQEYHHLTSLAQTAARTAHAKFYAFLAAVPCLFVGVAGFGIAWVRRGFSEFRQNQT
jgi:hypothetical protein